MPRPAANAPTEVELQILTTLWQEGPLTARQIHNALSGTRETNYSTTVKMLSVMLEKELVRRDETQRPQVYRAAVTQSRAQRRMLGDLVQKLFAGSTKSLVLQALSSQKATKADLAEIRQMLDEIEGDSQ
jgi:BlaI family transcriptional regulator, penicillinase repressor